jgi:hypothetical protein
VGQVLAERMVLKEILKILILRAWNPMGYVFFRALNDNMVLIDFEYTWDKARVMEGRP